MHYVNMWKLHVWVTSDGIIAVDRSKSNETKRRVVLYIENIYSMTMTALFHTWYMFSGKSWMTLDFLSYLWLECSNHHFVPIDMWEPIYFSLWSFVYHFADIKTVVTYNELVVVLIYQPNSVFVWCGVSCVICHRIDVWCVVFHTLSQVEIW